MSEAKDFQQRSAEQIVRMFEGGQRRVLLADEVGLGKTIVAKTVVELLRQKNQQLKVIYVCSNQNIIRQNSLKLGIQVDKVVKLSESRLSMVHHTIYQKGNDEYLIPITPSTSLKLTMGYGNANERSMIYALIAKDFEPAYREKLKQYLDAYAKQGSHTCYFSDNKLTDYKKENPDYYKAIRGILTGKDKYGTIVKSIKEELKKENSNRKYIHDLRTLFCEISMDMMQPDLVIMDEFQRYRDLMQDDENTDQTESTEESRLAQKLFHADSNPNILLVSATPYKAMTTLEEISEEGENSQFDDFYHLMKFLFDDRYAQFKKIWKAYSQSLGIISAENINAVIAAKEKAEQMLRKVMVRTERYQPNLANMADCQIMPTAEEVLEYQGLRTLIDRAAQLSENRRKPFLNTDYTKSSPYLLSFMHQYMEKSFIVNAFEGKWHLIKQELPRLLLRHQNLETRKKIRCKHAKLQAFEKIIFGEKRDSMHNLLWLPASLPYYRTNSIFSKQADASKVLVFSRWGFVPRMIAAMISYEASRRYPSARNNKSGNALEKYKKLLLSPFPNLAKYWTPKDYGMDLKGLKLLIQKRIKDAFKSIKQGLNGDIKVKESEKKHGYQNLLSLVKLLDENHISSDTKVLYYNDSILDTIANLVLASPGICLFRCFGADYGDTWDSCQESGLYPFANALVNMLGDYESQDIISKNTQSSTQYSRTLEYCAIGNLQAVIDEYAFVKNASKDDLNTMDNHEKSLLWESMQSAIITRSNIEVDTYKSFCDKKPKKAMMKKWFACDYAKITQSDQDERRKQSVQEAFNSPFRPFVLASTSVGQEGLDLHLYCRKIVHWNLPGNPVDLEQRSGRINRYLCLAIRRSLAHLFPGNNWKALFEQAYKTWHAGSKTYDDRVPHWCLPQEILAQSADNKIERIENIFLLYALSTDSENYNRLKKRLDLYRLTMGQPDQDFLIDWLDALRLNEEEKAALTFRLSPPARQE